MSLFSRRSMMIVAGCAMTLPLAAGTANATFDIDGDDAAPVDEAPVSVEGSISPAGGSGSVDSSVGHGALEAGRNGARSLSDAAELAADADGVVSGDRVTVDGSISVPGEQTSGSVSASPDGVSLAADTPLGNGSTHVEPESFDIHVK